MGDLIASGTLGINQAASIAASIANASSVKKDPSELQVVAAQLITRLMGQFKSNATDAAGLALDNSIANAVAAVAKSVAASSYKNNADKTNTTDLTVYTGYVNEIAGSAARAVSLSKLSQFELDGILLKISLAVQTVTPTVIGDTYVAQAVQNVRDGNNPSQYEISCNVNETETPVTNY